MVWLFKSWRGLKCDLAIIFPLILWVFTPNINVPLALFVPIVLVVFMLILTLGKAAYAILMNLRISHVKYLGGDQDG